MDYLDFELEIGPGSGREYPLAVVNAPAGEARETLRFPYDALALENRLLALQNALLRSGGGRRRFLSPEQQAVRDFGRDLFDALLTGEVRNRFDVSQERARQQDKGLRLKLRIRPPELAGLPWEFLFDPRRDEYLCLSRDTPVVRYLELPQPPQALAVTPPLRILGMVASPSDLEPLEVRREKGRLEAAIAGLQASGLMELTWLEGQTWRDLHRAMRGGPWHVFHFVGHGGFDRPTDEGFIALCDDDGESQRLTATELARLLCNHRPLRLAFLNSCEGARGGAQDVFSSTAAILIRRGLPAVLAMQYEITDRAAVELARAFYEVLADGFPVDAAVVEARIAVSLAVHNTVEWGTPALYMRAPDGVLFELQTCEVSQTSQVSKPPAPARQPFEPEMVLIPAGEFLMGSDPRKDQDAFNDEQPQHPLYLHDYYLAKTPVTNAQYLAFVQATDRSAPSHWEDGKIPRGKENHPVVNVTWRDAVAYCRWLSQVTGKPYRLPSEAEWEKAARGVDGRIYPWGNQWDASRCNTIEGGPGDATPVGAYPQGVSPHGLLDMAGNVWEWTSSLYRSYPYQADDGREDAESSDSRVLRGGSFSGNRWLARCAVRVHDGPSGWGGALGCAGGGGSFLSRLWPLKL